MWSWLAFARARCSRRVPGREGKPLYIIRVGSPVVCISTQWIIEGWPEREMGKSMFTSASEIAEELMSCYLERLLGWMNGGSV